VGPIRGRLVANIQGQFGPTAGSLQILDSKGKRSMLQVIKDFLAKVAGAGKGFLLPEELYRSIITSLGSGGMIGLIMTMLQAVLTNTATIFPNPLVGSLATMVLTLVIDLFRRMNQGSTPAPAPVPTPGPAPVPVPTPVHVSIPYTVPVPVPVSVPIPTPATA
jgi:hypothetical protein